MKIVVAIRNSGSKGKTETLRKLAHLFLEANPKPKILFPESTIIPAKGDFRLVLKIRGVIVGIESKGDPKTRLATRLSELENKYNCDMIFCSTRTRGETVTAVNQFCAKKKYQKIWASTYEVADETKQEQANALKAKQILELLYALKLMHKS